MKFMPLFLLWMVLCGCTSSEQANSGDSVSKGQEAPEGMVWIPGGEFVIGSDDKDASDAEWPKHLVKVDGFWMDRTEVTNSQFRKFVDETGYVTVAERPVDWEELKKMLPPDTPKPPDSVLQPGSLVFTAPLRVSNLVDYSQWWAWQLGADWQHPKGPDSSIDGKDNHPVVHIAYEDAVAYAEWAGKRLPTEAEWEFAARGGVFEVPFQWGDELTPNGEYLANFFQGEFPGGNSVLDGFMGSSPVGSFPANGYGLYDMIGNVWEWTSDWYHIDAYRMRAKGELIVNPDGPTRCYDPNDPYAEKRVVKGGSYLCSEYYCSNYRPSAKMATSIDSGQEHVGFRLAMD